MKTKLFFFAAAASLALASCSSDEVTESNAKLKGDAIRFAPTIQQTRTQVGAMSIFADNDQADIYANFAGEKYFQEVFNYTTANGFAAQSPYYWPVMDGTQNMVFTAFVNGTQTSEGVVEGFAPAADAADQVDLMVAKHTATAREDQVNLNFRHALSIVNVKAKNSSANLKVNVTGLRVGYVKTASNSFTYAGVDTDTKDAVNIPLSAWDLVDFAAPGTGETTASNYMYEQTVSWSCTGQKGAGMLGNEQDWLLLPQALKQFEKDGASKKIYSDTEIGNSEKPALTGAYIGLKMEIRNNNAAGALIADTWCYWPIDEVTPNWEPGKIYTYTIDVATGGYYGDDPDPSDPDPSLVPVLKQVGLGVTIDVYDPENYELNSLNL